MQYNKAVILIGILLGLLFTTGFAMNNYLKRTSESLGKNIDDLQVKLSENPKGKTGTLDSYSSWSSFKSNWNKTKDTWAIVVDHSEIDKIESSIARIDMLIPAGVNDETLPECSILKESITHIYEKEKVNLKNIL